MLNYLGWEEVKFVLELVELTALTAEVDTVKQGSTGV